MSFTHPNAQEGLYKRVHVYECRVYESEYEEVGERYLSVYDMPTRYE